MGESGKAEREMQGKERNGGVVGVFGKGSNTRGRPWKRS